MTRAAAPRTYGLGEAEAPIHPGGPPRRYGVDYEPGDACRPVWVWEGAGPGVCAARLTPAEALATWRDHLTRAGAGWLVPLLERMAAGERVEWAEVARGYERVHGAPPTPVG